MKLALVCLGALAAVCSAQAGGYANEWMQMKPAPASAPVRFSVFLKQKNVDRLEKEVLKRADPTSAHYAQWMTREEVLDIVAPAPSAAAAVVDAVVAACPGAAVAVTNDRDVVHFATTAACAEAALAVTLADWLHMPTGRHSVLLHEASPPPLLPPAAMKHAAVITGLVAIPRMSRASLSRAADPRLASRLSVFSAAAAAAEAEAKASGINSFGFNSPQVIRHVYNVPQDLFIKAKNNSICAMEFLPVGAPEPSNLQGMALITGVPYTPIARHVGAWDVGQETTEALLDVSMMETLAVHSEIVYITISDGWVLDMAQTLFGLDNPPYVTSVSYGWMEQDSCSSVTMAHCTSNGNSAAYVARANAELAKVAALGLSVIVAAGDSGAPSDNNDECQNTTNPISPIFPGASPWVTTVASTTLTNAVRAGSAPFDLSLAATNGSICKNVTYPCDTGNYEVVTMENNTYYNWTTGGGFSDYAPQPSWQKAAVQAYLKNNAASLPDSAFFNASNRGYPDVAAMGDRILFYMYGESVVAGTSASSPIFASVITLLNDARLQANKKPLGFLNPMLYQAAATQKGAFNDIVDGNNAWSLASTPCTANNKPAGYQAAPGWDPASGLGSPNFPVLLKYVLSLP